MELSNVLKLVWLIPLLTLNTIGGTDLSFRFIQKSLFPNVSPYIGFTYDNETTVFIPEELGKYLQFEKSTKPWLHVQLKYVLDKTGFKFSSGKGANWIGSWNKRLPKNVKEVSEYQKIVYTPGHIWLGRKSHQRLTEIDMIRKHGLENCPFILPSFILPKQFEDFKLAWEETENKLWILKLIYPTPFKDTTRSIARGVKLIKHWSEAQRLDFPSMVVQKYVHDPILFQGRKVEIRLFVVITNFNSLKVFLSERIPAKLGYSNYSASPESIDDICVHSRTHSKLGGILCNISLNNLPFTETTSLIFEEIAAKGHNVNVTQIKIKMEDATIKYIISAQSKIQKAWEKLRVLNRWYNLFALFAIDFILVWMKKLIRGS